MRRLAPLLRPLALGIALLAIGCGPRVGIRRALPPPQDVGEDRRIHVVVGAVNDTSTVGTINRVHGVWTGEADDPLIPLPAIEADLPGALAATGYFAVVPPEEADLEFRVIVDRFVMKVRKDEQPAIVDAGMDVTLTVLRPDGRQVVVRTYRTEAQRPLEEVESVHEAREVLAADATRELVGRILYEFAPTIDERAVRLDDADEEVARGVSLMKKGDFAAARVELEAVLARSPRVAAAHHNLGVIHEASGDFPAAERHYREAIAIASRRLSRDALNRVKGLRRTRAPVAATGR